MATDDVHSFSSPTSYTTSEKQPLSDSDSSRFKHAQTFPRCCLTYSNCLVNTVSYYLSTLTWKSVYLIRFLVHSTIALTKSEWIYNKICWKSQNADVHSLFPTELRFHYFDAHEPFSLPLSLGIMSIRRKHATVENQNRKEPRPMGGFICPSEFEHNSYRFLPVSAGLINR